MADTTTISKLLSYWLRHAPQDASLKLDPSGWAAVADVLKALHQRGILGGAAELAQVVQENDKKRFEYSDDGAMIRARQGHSISVELDWPVAQPPEFLFHGTVERFLPAIMQEGLKPQARHHVHLSPDVTTAARVGERRGRPVILRIAAAHMARDGHEFRLTTNGVWLTDHVPPANLQRI